MNFMGSAIFWIFIAFAVVALITYFERLIDLRRAQMDYQDFIKGVINILETGNTDEALAICEDTGTPISQVVITAINHRNDSARILRDAVDAKGRAEVGRLDRRMAALAIIGQITPLLGLLGTVIGFMKTIMAANSAEIVLRIDVLNGAMEALLPAAFGLSLAIPIAVMYGSLRVRLDRIVVELEAAASQIVGYIAASKERTR